MFTLPCHTLRFSSFCPHLLHVLIIDEGVLRGGALLPPQHGDGLPGQTGVLDWLQQHSTLC